MAYFSNSSEGDTFYEQCASCKYGERACPIFAAQTLFNYDQIKSSNAGDNTARDILNSLVTEEGICTMREEFKEDFAIDPNQLKMDL